MLKKASIAKFTAFCYIVQDMKAIVNFQGKNRTVQSGQRILVDRLAAEVGTKVEMPEVLLTIDGDKATVGTPHVADAKITATVLAHPRGEKIRVATYKRRKRTRKVIGHRSELTELQIA